MLEKETKSVVFTGWLVVRHGDVEAVGEVLGSVDCLILADED